MGPKSTLDKNKIAGNFEGPKPSSQPRQSSKGENLGVATGLTLRKSPTSRDYEPPSYPKALLIRGALRFP